MCGFSVIIGDKTDKISEMNALISHRGPDAEDFHSEANFSMGHRRLAIIDLSEDGKQPFVHQKTGNLIVFNGEIYNYIELREELIKLGHVFKTQTDTEVILASYEEWGEGCVKHFNGMWAFVLLDRKSNTFFVSRDRFGVKPLYYYKDDRTLAFASEIKQLLIFSNRKVNLEYASSYLVTGLVDFGTDTFFDEIKKVPASQNMIVNAETRVFRFEKYYRINRIKSVDKKFEGALARFAELFRSSIRLRLRSDVKVGTCLSGGLDSSSVASVAVEEYRGKDRFQGIFAQSTDPDTDESYYANLVANHNNINLNTIRPTYDDFVRSVDEVVYTQEEPFVSPSIFMQYFVMKKAKEIGCKVMLDGQGGDETLLGYEKYYSSVLYETWKNKSSFDFYEALKNAQKNNHRLTPLALFKYFFGMVSWRMRLLGHCFRARMLKSRYLFNNYWYLKTLSRCVMDSTLSLQRFEIFHTNLPSLLRYEDKNSMRHSIEARLPFLDYRLVEYNLNLAPEFKIKDGWSKYLLRVFLDTILPAEVVWRKKKLGFEAPEKIWIRLHRETMKDEIKQSKILERICRPLLYKVDGSWGPIFWRLYNIAVWERVYKVTL